MLFRPEPFSKHPLCTASRCKPALPASGASSAVERYPECPTLLCDSPAALRYHGQRIGGNSFFGPVYDGVTIPEDGHQYAREGKLSGIKAIIGANEQEGAAALTTAGTPVYMYRYNYQADRPFGARHGDELHYIWGAAHILTSNDNAAKKQLAKTLHGAWVNFIRTGDPNAVSIPISSDIPNGLGLSNGTGIPNDPAIPKWPMYKVADKQVMVFSDVDTVTRLKEVYNDKRFPSAVFVIK